MKNIMLFGLLSACAVAATGCNSDDKDAKIIERPAPEEKKTDGKESVDTGKIAELQRQKDAAEAKAKESDKKAADAEAALKKATEEKADPETLTKLTNERDEAQAAAAQAQADATQAKADLEALQKLEATVVSQYQGDWTSNETILGTECVTLVRVKDKTFQKLISCSTESGVGLQNQYEQGSLEGITVSTAGKVSADFAVKSTSCQWIDGEKIVPVGFVSESGSFKAGTMKRGAELAFAHPVREEVKTLAKENDVCKEAKGLTALACAFIADAQTIEPNHQVGCFVSDTAADFRHTKEITAIK